MGASVQLSSHSAAFEAPDHIGMTPRLSLRNITKRYPGITANDHVSLDIAPGEVLAILGENGAGKSTLMKIIYGAARPDEGEISFDGHPLGVETPAQARELGIAMVHQHFALFDTLSVTENVALGLSTGISAAEIEREIRLLGEKYGLEVDPASVVMELSMGERQRVEILRALMTKPKLLILDEPTSQLDPIAASEFLHCVSRINHELGTTVIITEHRLDEVLPLSDRVLVIENNGISAFDSPQKVGKILKEKDSKTFLSMPAPMQIWQAVTENDNTDCPVTVPSGKKWLSEYAKSHKMYELKPESIQKHSDKEAVSLNDIWFRYEKSGADVLKGLSLKIYQGEFVAILGGNGMGKSTALSIICSLNKPYRC